MLEALSHLRGEIEGRHITSSVVAGLIVMLLAAIGDLPLWGIALTGLAGFTLLPWGLIGWRRLRDLRYQEANFEKWDQVGLPALWQAACLFDDIEPYIPVGAGTPCYPTLQMLKSAIINNEIEPGEKFGGTDAWERISRDDLRAYAEKIGRRPLSLFPEDRK